MTYTTQTQSTAILTIAKGGLIRTSERYPSVEVAKVNRDALAILMPHHTFGIIRDESDRESAYDDTSRFEVESANGKVKHAIPSYGIARGYARKFASPENMVVIRQYTVEAETISDEE